MANFKIEGTFRNGTGEVHLRLTGNEIVRHDHNGSFAFEHNLQPGNWIVTIIGFTNGNFEFKITNLDNETIISHKIIEGPSQIAEHFFINII